MYVTLGMLKGSAAGGGGGGGGDPPPEPVSGPPVLEDAFASEHMPSGATRSVPLPPVIASGNLIVIAFGGSGFSLGPPFSASGYTVLGSPAAGFCFLYKIAAGTEGGTSVTVTTDLASGDSQHLALVYSNVDTTVEGDFTFAATTGALPSAPVVTAGWGAANNLVTTLYLGMGAVNVNSYPSNCSLYRETFNAGTYGIGVACASIVTASLDPTTWTLNAPANGICASIILKGFP